MGKIDCDHRWVMINQRNGYLVVEGCFHCGNRISFFSAEPVPPIDKYRENDHFWTYFGSFQASKFDLKCEKCSKEISLDEVASLMCCMNCNPSCDIYKTALNEKEKKVWVYVALCTDSSHTTKRCVSEEGIQALNKYFNDNIQDSSKKIIVLPCNLRKSVDTCQGIILVDVGLTELY